MASFHGIGIKRFHFSLLGPALYSFFCYFFFSTAMKNHFEVKKYTNVLNQQEVKDLGLALGLYITTFNTMSPQTIHGATIEAWLQKRDNVIKTCGTTTWRALAKGFQVVEQHGCVEKIRRGKYSFSMLATMYIVYRRNTSSLGPHRVDNYRVWQHSG